MSVVPFARHVTSDTDPRTTEHAVAACLVDAVKVYSSGTEAVRALDNVAVGFRAGQFTAIIGPCDSGKSTLLRCLAGLDPLSAGQAFLGEVELATLRDRDLTVLHRDFVGFVFRTVNLVSTLTAGENVTLPVRLAGREPDPDWLARVVAAVRIADCLDHQASALSAGQQQQVAVARALITEPQIVFADEPTGDTDPGTAAVILESLRRAVSELGQTVVMATRSPLAAAYADTVVFLANGRIVNRLNSPTSATVLDYLKTLGAPGQQP